MVRLTDAAETEVNLCFQCPGCGSLHCFRVEGEGRPKWSWDGNVDQPTFSPSLLVNQHHAPTRCHLFLRDGKIEFLNDCHHELAGQTVDLPDTEWK